MNDHKSKFSLAFLYSVHEEITPSNCQGEIMPHTTMSLLFKTNSTHTEVFFKLTFWTLAQSTHLPDNATIHKQMLQLHCLAHTNADKYKLHFVTLQMSKTTHIFSSTDCNQPANVRLT